jgi:hypothetical protein
MSVQKIVEFPARPVIEQTQAYAGKLDAKSANKATVTNPGQHHFFIMLPDIFWQIRRSYSICATTLFGSIKSTFQIPFISTAMA